MCLVNLDNNNVFLEKLPNKIENDKSFVGYYAICKQSCHSCPYNAFLFCDDFFKSWGHCYVVYKKHILFYFQRRRKT